jgi:triacylglycerol lipase
MASTPVAPRLRAPIVLVHGLLGFRVVRVVGRPVFSYFPGIPGFFEASGNRVFDVALSPTASVMQRATELREHFHNELPSEPVHVIAHSMGGLDSRCMISRLGMADRVLSLTTIGTPHRGTSFADWGIRRFERVAKPLLKLLRIPDQAFYDLTTESCAAFNAETPDVPGVKYQSVAGQCGGGWLGMEWRLPHYIVQRTEGPNDGVVSIQSATYGDSTDVWDGDHLSLVNWPNPQAMALGLWRYRFANYAKLLQRLADAGF